MSHFNEGQSGLSRLLSRSPLAGKRRPKDSRSRGRRKPRVCRYEVLEARRVLDAAIWHNVLRATDVDAEQGLRASDALAIINELTDRRYSDPGTGALITEFSEQTRPPFYDVNCDGKATAHDALVVINALSGSEFGSIYSFASSVDGETTGGSYDAVGCHVRLNEGTSLRTEVSSQLTLPSDDAGVSVRFETPVFDTASTESMQDAFEVTVTDTAGNSLTQPFAYGRTASLNWSERTADAVGLATSLDDGGTSPTSVHEAVINLAHLDAGTEVIVTARLLNNDRDETSSVVIHDMKPVTGMSMPPMEYAGESTSGLQSGGLLDGGPLVVENLEDVSASMEAHYGRTSYISDRSQIISELVVTNRGNQAVTGQMIVVLDQFSEIDTFVMHPDGLLADGRPYFDMTASLDGPLGPGESTRPREIRFTNPGDTRFGYRLTTLGDLNVAPSGFTTTPLTKIEAGHTYHYDAVAADEDDQSLVYSVVTGPPEATIDSETGRLSWETLSSDLGRHHVVLRATDPYGLFVEQRFEIEVVESLANRPPNFVSDPITDAIASSGFEITTVGVGDSPAGVATISGFQGPRIVTINSGEQTVGVYAGENNDRFDDATSYSTGFPAADGQLFDVGYKVDVGIPEYLSASDSNGVFGMDQGDLNGDGILDMVTLFAFNSSVLGLQYQLRITAVLGDGDGGFGAPIEIYAHDIGSNIYDPRNLLLRDFTGDGNLDVVAVERRQDPRLIVITGNGDGTFGEALEQTFTNPVSDFFAADVNEDGVLDLVGRTAVLGFGANYEAVWMKGVGDGTFAEPVVIGSAGEAPNCCYSTQTRPYDVLDVNGDSHQDLVIAVGSNIQVYHNDGAGNFTLAADFDPEGNFTPYYWIRGGDFNGDGNVDLAFHRSTASLDVLLGDGSGIDFTYQPGPETDAWLSNYAGSDNPVDVDFDGDLDLIFGNANGDWTSTKVAINDGTGLFQITEYAMLDFSGDVEPLEVGDIARGAMFGDYNRDGVMDYSYFTESGDFDGVGIRLGTRPGEFGGTRTVPAISGAIWKETLAADFDGDGAVDLLDVSNDRIYLGNGDGTFAEPFPSLGVSRPTGVGAVADFNLDGLPDVVATRARANGSRYYVALSNGDGTFTVSDDQPGGGFYGYNDFQIADFNSDGFPDFVTKDSIARYIDVYLNDPQDPGVFTHTHREQLPDGSQGVNVSFWEHAFVTSDFTGDGLPDLAFASRESGQEIMLVVMAGDGAGAFTLHNQFAAYQEDTITPLVGSIDTAGDYMAGDLDGDDDVDLVIASVAGPLIFLNDGTGVFELFQHLEDSGRAQRSRDSWLVDFNEDGHLDLVTDSDHSSTAQGRGPLSVRLGRGDATFEPPQRIGMVGSTEEGVFIDVDHDGHLDFVHGSDGVGNYHPDTTSIYAGRRDDLVDLVAVDLDGDGNEEVLTIQDQMDRLQIFVGDNLGRLTRQSDLLTGRSPKAVTAADIDADGQMELITANRASRSLSVFAGNLASGYASTDIPVGNGPIDVAAADVNGDGHIDIVALDDSLNALWVFQGDGTSTLGQPTAIAIGDKPGRLTLADADGDGTIEAVVTLPDTNRLMILSDLASNPTGSPIYVDLASTPSDVTAVDLNDDGNPDLAVTLSEDDVLAIFFGRGNNQYARPQNIRVGDHPMRVTLADADEDGRTDLIVANSGDATASVIYNRFDPNEVYRYDSDAVDPDDDPLTYSIVDGPGGLIINRDSGALLWAASPDQVGVHDVTIAADDGRGGVATQSFKIDVVPARENAAPLIATEPVTSIGANEKFSYAATAVDGDQDALRYRLLNAPDGATLDPTTGELDWDGRGQAFIYAPYDEGGDVRVPADASLQPSSVTVEGWFNIHTLTASNSASVLFRLPGAYGNAFYLRTRFNTQLELVMNFDGQTITFRPEFEAREDRWVHMALTIDDATKTATIYADGRVVGTTSIPDSIAYSEDGILEVGYGGQYKTMATLDNFRVWNVARSAAEIQEGMGRQYENHPELVLDFRFEDTYALSVKDYSGNNNFGYRTSNGLLPQPTSGLVTPGQHDFSIAVEDGRGGYDEQSFTVNVLPELRGSITGHLFDDLNRDGDQDDGSEEGIPAEPPLEGWQLYIDTNGNAYPDPSEPTATTDANGDYRFEGLLPGSYPVRVSPMAGYDVPPGAMPVSVTANDETAFDLAIEQLSLSHIRGQLLTEDAEAVAYWKVFADLDNDGSRGENEPMAVTDRNGDYALTGLDSGTYKIHTELPAGWADTAGRDGLTVTLADDEISAGNDFIVEPTNTSVTGGVHFVTTPSTTIEARQTFRYASVAMGIAADAITYDLSLAPAGMTIDPQTGLVAWRPSIDQVGEHLVILRATNVSGSISLHDFNLNVTAPNTPPVITRGTGLLPVIPTFSTTAYSTISYSYDIIAQDAESTTLTYTLTNAPAGATIDATTGRIAWTPAASDVGSHAFTVEVADEAGASTTATWSVEVTTETPTVLPLDVNLPRTTAAVVTDYFSRIGAIDQLGRPVSWSLSNGPAGLTVEPDGTIEWTPSSSQLGTQSVELAATTADGDTETITFEIEVTGRLKNAPPSIDSAPLLSVSLGQPYEYDVMVSDPDRDILAFTLLDAPIGMSVHPSMGHVRWTPAGDQLGEHVVLIQVSDPLGATATQEFTLNVSRFGGPPRIVSVPPTEANVGSSLLYTVVAIDREGDPLTFTLLTAPTGMTIVETTGEISWTPAVDQVGQQDVVIQVSDGVGGAATQAFAINVAAGTANLPPQITSDAPRFGSVGTEFIYTLSATDPESTTITYSLGRGPTGMTVDAATGVVSWTPATDQAGKHVVTLIATDAGGASAIESFEFDVLAQNSAPVINSIAPLNVSAGEVFKYDVLVSDADLDQLSYELTSVPAGAEIDSFGRIRWQTDISLIGSHDFTVKVSDPRGGEVMQSFTLEVIEDVIPPKLSLIENLGEGSRNVLPWQGPFKVFVKAIDNVAIASLTLQANGQDIPLDAAGTATFTFEDWTFQTINATATAIDTNGNVTTKTITFDYDFPEGWSGAGTEDIPTAVITSPTDTESVTGMVSIVGTAAHEDLFGYKLSYRRVDETSYTEFYESTTAVTNGELGVWDTSLLVNDEYVIRLEVATNAGIVNVVEHHVGLAGELKLGNFRLSFTDMVIPVAGIPIEITRIYDTLQADREGDFGYGWRLEYRNTDLRVGLPNSGLEDIGIYSALRPGVKVYLNVPGEGRQGFTFDPDIRVLPGFGGNNLVLARPRFTPDPGVTSTLSTGTSSYLQVNEQGELYAPGGIPYNPASPSFGGAYVLTTREKITYRIDGGTGKLLSADDRNGNTIRFTDAAILNDSDQSMVHLRRDSRGRIVSIGDNEGGVTQYLYSSGDLVRVVDPDGYDTKVSYDGQHRITEIIDPLERPIVRNEYDSNGRLTKRTDASGREVQFDVDASLRQEVIEDVDGAVTVHQYDNRGNLVHSTDPLGGVTQRSFDSNNNLIEVVNANGEITRQTFDSTGNLLMRTEADGGITRFSYASGDRLTSWVDPTGRGLRFEYDEQGNLVKRIDLQGNMVVQRSVNSKGLIESETDADGNRTTFTYDAMGNQTSVSDPLGRSQTQTYDATGTPITFETAGGTRYEFKTDSRGLYNEASSETGASIKLVFDGTGELASVIDAEGVEAFSISYDSNQQETMFEDSLNHAQTREYNEKGELVRLVNETGAAVLFVYDALGRQIRVDLPDGGTIKNGYDPVGRLITREDPSGATTTYDYDPTGRLISQTDPLGGITRYQYDLAGRLTHVTDRGDYTTETIYDDRGLAVETVFADGSRIQREYDTKGELIAVMDPLGQVQRFAYDLVGNLVTVMNPDGSSAHFVYNDDNLISEQTDALGRTTQFQYDEAGRLVSKVYPDGSTVRTIYNAAGLVTSQIDSDGSKTDITMDRNGRVVERRFADGLSESFVYNDDGSLAESINDQGTTRYQYDTTGRPTKIEFPNDTELIYTYDARGLRQSVTQSFADGLAKTTQYTYDELGRIKSVTTTDDAVVSYHYDSRDNVTRIDYPNGIEAEFAYDSFSRMTLAQYVRGEEVLASVQYAYDAAGRRSEARYDSGRLVEYSYNDRGWLVDETHYDGDGLILYQQSHSYDAVGNAITRIVGETETTLVYNLLDQVVSSGMVSFTYDEDGRLQSKTVGEQTIEYRYDAEGQLIRVVGSDVDVTYQYDASGYRLSRSVGDEETIYANDPFDLSGVTQVVGEYRDEGAEAFYYVYGDRPLIQSDAAEHHHYMLLDGSTDVIAIADESGVIAARHQYDAFGMVIESEGNWPSELGFAAEHLGGEEGLVYLRARYYDPVLQRFISRDPAQGDLADPQSLHRYLYANNNPVTYVDPTGETPFSLAEVQVASTVTGGLIGGVFSFVGAYAGGKRGFALVTETFIGAAFGAFGGAFGASLSKAFTSSTVVAKAISNPLVAKYAGRIAYAIPPTVASFTEDVTKGINSGDIKNARFTRDVFFNAGANLFFNVLVGPGVVDIREIRPVLNATSQKLVNNGTTFYKILTSAERAALKAKYTERLGELVKHTLHLNPSNLSKSEEVLLDFMFNLVKIIQSAV
ncbi:putative deoxyribonuclease RhsB [Novipirellula aureliae]|uniref:Putative deoxyribonuclease RhsB n=1 Tax=Novipirellula aureliae TaxID=2527966 RepID=A0A5C6DX84_9BACT|nr:FG-GAP-like repeat-containing protein [Novipirellula aureliae]TWU41350.1 putative deoxyribonuclease RhsB [Novipirellula aureliae]